MAAISTLANPLVLDETYCEANDPDLKPGDYVEITVADTGNGIPKEILDQIFDPFFTTKDPGEGTGLGLSSIMGCIKQHHGSIHVYSEEGRGSVFRILLPRATSSTAHQSDPNAPVPTGSGGILLVDDEALLRKPT